VNQRWERKPRTSPIEYVMRLALVLFLLAAGWIAFVVVASILGAQ